MSNSTAKELREEGIGYYQESRSFTFSIVSILPLVVAYHLGIVQSGHTERNMAETWLTGPLHRAVRGAALQRSACPGGHAG
jgi:hypothetical protein